MDNSSRPRGASHTSGVRLSWARARCPVVDAPVSARTFTREVRAPRSFFSTKGRLKATPFVGATCRDISSVSPDSAAASSRSTADSRSARPCLPGYWTAGRWLP
jgi:hypothetical protein